MEKTQSKCLQENITHHQEQKKKTGKSSYYTVCWVLDRNKI